MVVEWRVFSVDTYSDACSWSEALAVASLTATGGNPCGPDVWLLLQPDMSRSAAAAAACGARMECLTLFRRDRIRAQPVSVGATLYAKEKRRSTGPRRRRLNRSLCGTT